MQMRMCTYAHDSIDRIGWAGGSGKVLPKDAVDTSKQKDGVEQEAGS